MDNFIAAAFIHENNPSSEECVAVALIEKVGEVLLEANLKAEQRPE
jgi:hypothetical protein